MATIHASPARLPDPFGDIALAFSGGGFRAAAFALGTLSYLEHLQVGQEALTKRISMISSASGGTITNLLYSSSIHEGVDFKTFFDHAFEKLKGDGLLEKVLTVLNDDSQWYHTGDRKRRNLINAFAKVYDRELFNHKTLGVFAEKKHVRKFEICCNATEFYRGLTFRFQTNGTLRWDQKIGNRYLYFDVLKLETFRKIKLADVLAASSCFPLGFEPIMYPDDFCYPGLSAETLREALCYENYNEHVHHLSDAFDGPTDPKAATNIRSFGLMDGGITDNQGLYSLMIADKKRRRKKKNPDPFDLMIITDVSSYFMDKYNDPELENDGAWRTKNADRMICRFERYIRWPKKIKWTGLILFAVSVGVAATTGTLWLKAAAIFSGGATLFAALLAFLLQKWPAARAILAKPDKVNVAQFVRDNLPIRSFSDMVITKLLSYLGNVKFNVLERMLRARFSSVVSMVMDVNLKQARRLIFEMFYNEPCWQYRRVSNFIYELSSFNAPARSNRLADPERLKWKATAEDLALLDSGLELLRPIAENARTMGTTLWFDEELKPRLDDIIRAGQFTTCMNLLEYVISLERTRVKFEKDQISLLIAIKQQLINDIDQFKVDPNYLYHQKK